MAGELTLSLKSGLKKAAKEAIEESTGALRSKYPKVYREELYKIAEIEFPFRKKISIANFEEIGKLGNKIIFKLVDENGIEIGQLIRNIGTKGRSANYQLIFKGEKINLNSEITLYNAQMAKTTNLPIEGSEQIIYADINIPVQITEQYSGFGELMLDESLAYFKNNAKFGKVDGNMGYWVQFDEYYKDYGGQSINLKQFWEAVGSGKSYEEATFETFTGQWAEKNGFTKVVFDPKRKIERNQVVVKFLK